MAIGFWPLLNMRIYECMNGPMMDKWLAKSAEVARRNWRRAAESKFCECIEGKHRAFVQNTSSFIFSIVPIPQNFTIAELSALSLFR